VIIDGKTCSGHAGTAQSSARLPALASAGNLPDQFKEKWTIDACNGVGPFGTGLMPGDRFEIVQNGTEIRISTNATSARDPDPTLMHAAPLVLIGPQDSASPNVLTQKEADSLCTADTKKFETAFAAVLAAHAYSLTYLACETALHGDDELVLIVCLPNVVEKERRVQFVMAIVARGVRIPEHEHDHHPPARTAKTKGMNHNGIVHGNP
jgi:hypothetical protein